MNVQITGVFIIALNSALIHVKFLFEFLEESSCFASFNQLLLYFDVDVDLAVGFIMSAATKAI